MHIYNFQLPLVHIILVKNAGTRLQLLVLNFNCFGRLNLEHNSTKPQKFCNEKIHKITLIYHSVFMKTW